MEAVIVLDCGATNIRAIAVDRDGKILASRAFPNQTAADPHFSGGLIWDIDYIVDRISEACRTVVAELGETDLKGVCATSFGVDGAPYNGDGKQIYPVISWACERTRDIMKEVYEIFPLPALHHITGLNEFHFNTLYKLYWLKKYREDVFQDMEHWLFVPAIISGHLCGSSFTDISMLGTSMLCDMNKRDVSKDILHAYGLDEAMFPNLLEAGEKAGEVTDEAAGLTGLPAGLPVFSAGHDTQFAIFGSGARVNEPVLSSGTWEVMMVRTPVVKPGRKSFEAGITTELDAVPGLYNPGIQWLGSKRIEEIRKEHFIHEMNRSDIYDIMIGEAIKAESQRGKIFRALLEELSEKARDSLQLLENHSGFKASSLIVVGGGSKNKLWNDLRSQALGIEVRTIPQAETTVLGAARILYENLEV